MEKQLCSIRLVLVTHSFTCKKKNMYTTTHTQTHMIEREGGFDMINLGFLSIDGQRTVQSCMYVLYCSFILELAVSHPQKLGKFKDMPRGVSDMYFGSPQHVLVAGVSNMGTATSQVFPCFMWPLFGSVTKSSHFQLCES